MRTEFSKRVASWGVALLTASTLLALILATCVESRSPARSSRGGGPVPRAAAHVKLPPHFAGGFSITSASDARSAAAAGITTVFVYGSADPTTSAALGMPRVEGMPWSLLLGYECFRLMQIERGWPGCENRDLIPRVDELLGKVEAYVRSVQHDERVVGYWILDDWPPFDPGAARALLLTITHLIHELTPGRPTICGFGANFGPDDSASSAPMIAAIAANYAPGTCDIVAPYIYSDSVTDPATAPSAFDWSMQRVLPQVESALRSRGWNPAMVPLIGIAQAWGGTRTDIPGLYEIVPTAADLAQQSASYCQHGAVGIVYYAWSDSEIVGMQTPANNAQLAAGVEQGIALCRSVWAHGT